MYLVCMPVSSEKLDVVRCRLMSGWDRKLVPFFAPVFDMDKSVPNLSARSVTLTWSGTDWSGQTKKNISTELYFGT